MSSDFIIRISVTDKKKFLSFMEEGLESDNGFDAFYLLTEDSAPVKHSDTHLEEENDLALLIANSLDSYYKGI